MAYKNLRQLVPSKQVSWEIKVKVIRMWKSINYSTDELMSLDMILVDEQVQYFGFLHIVFIHTPMST